MLAEQDTQPKGIRLPSHSRSHCHPFWLSFNAKLCETRGSCSSCECSCSGPGLVLGWGRKHVLCLCECLSVSLALSADAALLIKCQAI